MKEMKHAIYFNGVFNPNNPSNQAMCLTYDEKEGIRFNYSGKDIKIVSEQDLEQNLSIDGLMTDVSYLKENVITIKSNLLAEVENLLSGKLLESMEYTAFEIFAHDYDIHVGESIPRIGKYWNGIAYVTTPLTVQYGMLDNSKLLSNNGVDSNISNSSEASIPAGMTESFLVWTLAGNKKQYVDWGDGTIEFKNSKFNGEILFQHTYTKSGNYIIKVFGDNFCRIQPAEPRNPKTNLICRCLANDLPIASNHTSLQSFAAYSLRLQIIECPSWSMPEQVESLNMTFERCYNLISVSGMGRYSNIYTCKNIFNFDISLKQCDFKIPGHLASASEGARYAFSNCWSLIENINNLLPSTGFVGEKIDLQNIFYCNQANIHKVPISGVVPAWMLWEDTTKIFSNTASYFTNTSDEIRAQVPISWGGTNNEIIVPKRISDIDLKNHNDDINAHSNLIAEYDSMVVKPALDALTNTSDITKFKVLLATPVGNSTSSELLNEMIPSSDESGNLIQAHTTRFYLNKTESFILKLTKNINECNIIIDWGDNNKTILKDEASNAFNAETMEIKVSHTYSEDYIKNGTQSQIDNSIYFNFADVTIHGSDYSNISHKDTLESNRICECLNDNYPIASHLTDLSNFLNGSRLIRKIDATVNSGITHIKNLSNFANSALNLNYVFGFNLLPESMESMEYAFNGDSLLQKVELLLPRIIQGNGFAYLFNSDTLLKIDIASILPLNGFISKNICVDHMFAGCTNLFGNIPDNIFWGDINNEFTLLNGKLVTSACYQVFSTTNTNGIVITISNICKNIPPIWCNTNYKTMIRVKFDNAESNSNEWERNQICLKTTIPINECDVIIGMTNSRNTGYRLSESVPTGIDFRCVDNYTCTFELRYANIKDFLVDGDTCEIWILGKDYERIYASGSYNHIYEALTEDLPVAKHLTDFSYLMANTANQSGFNETSIDEITLGSWFNDDKIYNFTRAFAKCNNLTKVNGFKNIKSLIDTNIFQLSNNLIETDLYSTRSNPIIKSNIIDVTSNNTNIELNTNTKIYTLNIGRNTTLSFTNTFSSGKGNDSLREGFYEFDLWIKPESSVTINWPTNLKWSNNESLNEINSIIKLHIIYDKTNYFAKVDKF